MNRQPIPLTGLDAANSINANSYLVAVNSPDSLTNKKTIKIRALDVARSLKNFLQISISNTPANSSIEVEKGTIFSDGDYLYVAVDTNHLKRIGLQDF